MRGKGATFYPRLPWRLSKPIPEPRPPGATSTPSIRGWMLHDNLEGNSQPGLEQLLPGTAGISAENSLEFKQRCGAETLFTTSRETAVSMLSGRGSTCHHEGELWAAFSEVREVVRQGDPIGPTVMARRCWAFCDVVLLQSLAWGDMIAAAAGPTQQASPPMRIAAPRKPCSPSTGRKISYF
jgi:hypothetical protein